MEDLDWYQIHCENNEKAQKVLTESDRFVKLVLNHDDFIHAKIVMKDFEEDLPWIVFVNKETIQKTEQQILRWKSNELKRRIQNGTKTNNA